jgi:uracil-DNA glycosylase family 4
MSEDKPTVSDHDPMTEAEPSPRRALSLAAVAAEIVGCRACPRLVAWREEIAREKRLSFREEEYWGRPVPGFGDPRARLLVVGLAPAAHGGNRTGRVFTGDRSGDWVFGALYRAGYANQPTSVDRDDGLTLSGCYVGAVVRCAPPANKPTPAERDRCLPYLAREIELLDGLRVVVALGQFAFDACLNLFSVRPRPRFGHLAEVDLPSTVEPGGSSGPLTIIGSFHPSQQNTFTGKLTQPMFDAVFDRARVLIG